MSDKQTHKQTETEKESDTEKFPSLILYCDGASRGNPGPASIGAALYQKEDNQENETANSEPVREVSRAIGTATNNIAEYKSLIGGLEAAREAGADTIDIRMDSELIVRQITGQYRVKNENLKPLFQEVKGLLAQFKDWRIKHVPRAQNKKADSLANLALDQF